MKLKALILGAALSGSSLLANTVTLTYDSPAYNGSPDLGGGEFRATVKNGANVVVESFLTFCLEHNKFVDLNVAYTYDNNTNVVQLQNDTISAGTAELYARFLLGSLGSPSGPYTNGNHDFNAGLLQDAIWMLEGEAGYTYSTSNYYVNIVDGLFGGRAGATANESGTYHGYTVLAMNLWSGTVDKQSQLYAIKPDTHNHVPDTGMTAVLLGLGLLSLIAFRRKL